jgi:hypothetical protein
MKALEKPTGAEPLARRDPHTNDWDLRNGTCTSNNFAYESL